MLRTRQYISTDSRVDRQNWMFKIYTLEDDINVQHDTDSLKQKVPNGRSTEYLQSDYFKFFHYSMVLVPCPLQYLVLNPLTSRRCRAIVDYVKRGWTGNDLWLPVQKSNNHLVHNIISTMNTRRNALGSLSNAPLCALCATTDCWKFSSKAFNFQQLDSTLISPVRYLSQLAALSPCQLTWHKGHLDGDV